MSRMLLLVANAMAGFADAGVGAALVALAGLYLHHDVTIVGLLVGSMLALSPDIDIVVPIVRGQLPQGTTNSHHMSLLHRPVLMIPALTAAGYIVGGPFWGVCAALCVTSHFIHDTPPVGDCPLNWLWPLGKDKSPFQAHEEWLIEKWLIPHPRGVTELLVGMSGFVLALLATDHIYLACAVPLIVWCAVYQIWSMAYSMAFRIK